MIGFNDLPRGLPGTHASDAGQAARAIWTQPNSLHQSQKWQYAQDRILIGCDEAGNLIGLDDDRHAITVAGSRAGKGVSVILPNLLLYSGSMLVLDPKGENANLTAARRGQGEDIGRGGLGHDVYVIDPFKAADQVPDHYRAVFNPIARLDPFADEFIDDCYNIADAMVMTTGKESTLFFDDTARSILRGFIAWVAVLPDPAKRSLAEVHRLLNQGEEAFGRTLDDMVEDRNRAWGLPARIADMIAGMSEKEEGSVMSSVRQHLSFLDSPPMAKTLSGNGRTPNMRDWKMGGQTVYLCLPAGRLASHTRFFRLFLNQLLQECEYNKAVPDTPAVLMLDEMHTLGRMQILQTASALIASFGVKIWSIWQDINQLEGLYGAQWQGFISNAGLFQSFGLNDMNSLRQVSDRLGLSSMLEVSAREQTVGEAIRGFSGQSRSVRGTPLLTPEEVAYHFSRQSGAQTIIYPGASPIWLRRIYHYDDMFRDFLPSPS